MLQLPFYVLFSGGHGQPYVNERLKCIKGFPFLVENDIF